MFVIMSAELTEMGVAEKLQATWSAEREHIRPLPYRFRKVTGSWEGSVEVGFQVQKPEGCDPREFRHEMCHLGFECLGQEAVLVVDDDGDALMHYTDGRVLPAGKWQHLHPREVEGLDGWTFIDGHFFVAA